MIVVSWTQELEYCVNTRYIAHAKLKISINNAKKRISERKGAIYFENAKGF